MFNPLALLLAVGGLLAVNLALVKAASGFGASPLIAAVVSTFGAGVALLVAARVKRGGWPPARGRLAFFIGAGAVSYALPNGLVFFAAKEAGAAYAAVLYAFVPGLTYVVALLWGVDRWSWRRGAGLLLGFVGATVVVSARFGLSGPSDTLWILLPLLAPISVAVGNVARSRYWPPGADALEVAPGLLLSSGALMGGAAIVLGEQAPVGEAAAALGPVLLVSAIYYALYFVLQMRAGAVYLSQIGYVAAAFGLLIGAAVFGERADAGTLIGVALVALGVLLVRPARGEIAPQAAVPGSKSSRSGSPVHEPVQPAHAEGPHS